MEMVTKTAAFIIAIMFGGSFSLLAVDPIEPQPSADPSGIAKTETAAPLEKVVLSKDQLAAAALRYSSRYTPSEKAEESKALSSKLRNIDPFGLPTYPTAEVEKPDETVLASGVTAAPERITLGHALRTMKINGINLEHGEILIGSRNMFEGDIAEVFYKGQTFMAELTEVSGYRLLFVDTKTKEEFTKSLTMLPAPNFETAKELDSKLSLQDKSRQLETIGR